VYAWSYAQQWCDFQESSTFKNNNISGPIFISIGTAEKLQTFLELNPSVPKEAILVDDYSHKLYKDLGFSRFDQISSDKINDLEIGKLFQLFQLGVGNLFNYATQALTMAPTEGNVNWLDLPEGGLRNGGTLVVNGEDVIYQWCDAIPSDVPKVEDVVKIALDAAAVHSKK